MIYDADTSTATIETNESVYNFCRAVILIRDTYPVSSIKCEINDIFIHCGSDDTVDSLVTKYTEAHEKFIESREHVGLDPIDTSHIYIWTRDINGKRTKLFYIGNDSVLQAINEGRIAEEDEVLIVSVDGMCVYSALGEEQSLTLDELTGFFG